VRRSIRIYEKSLPAESPRLAVAYNNLARLDEAVNNYPEAEAMFRRALAIDEKALGPQHREVGGCLKNLAKFFASRGRYSAAEEYYGRALAIFEKSPDDQLVVVTLEAMAELFWKEKRLGQARLQLERAIAIREKRLPVERALAVDLTSLAFLYYQDRRYTQAEPLALRASAILEKTDGPPYPDVSANLMVLGNIRRKQGRNQEAEPLLKRSLDIQHAFTSGK
jgi:tetratricopeptide (TPR) repeat protein